MKQHVCRDPQSLDFQDGSDASGCWMGKDGLHYEQVAGSSGVYLIATDLKTGEVVRDDRPWQMTA